MTFKLNRCGSAASTSGVSPFRRWSIASKGAQRFATCSCVSSGNGRSSGWPFTNATNGGTATGTDLRRSDDKFVWHSLRATAAFRF